MGALSTLTVVFTDVVGSTTQRVHLGEEAADALVRRHDALVRDAVAGAGGRVVKTLGDGAMACFASAADAVGAAVCLQQALARHAAGAAEEERLQVRVGVSTGDVSEQDGDLFGTPVVEASRLCASAAGGEILVAELVRLLARGRSGLAFEPLGELELRGLPEPVPACRVLWTPAPSDTAAPVPLPPVLAAAPSSSYVGRAGLLQELQEAWRRVDKGGRHTLLLAGEPGIGKTRTATELARSVHAEGGLVLFGRCDEALAAPYQPFVEALDTYVRAVGAAAELGRLPGELQRLVPELPSLVPQAGLPVATDVRSEEYRLFEAVTSWLGSASRAAGLLLVLDDLHWATSPTLHLLLHVLRRLPEYEQARVLVVCTYRDTDVDRRHPLVGALAELRRQPDVRRMLLVGLSAEEVLQVLEEAAGHELDEAARVLGRLLHVETEGNPFFVGEVLRHLVEAGAVRRVEGRWQVPDAVDVDIPEGVRDVVGRRVSRLSAQANAVLSVAAVVGREASVDVLAAVSGLEEDAVCEALDEGVRARLLQETRADHYRFSHALVRTTLYEELSATRRRRVHRKVAGVLERLHSEDVVGVAHHLLEAGPDGADSARLVRASLAAGEHALARRAPADAEVWFRHALELVEDSRDERAAITATIGLGTAQRDQGRSQFRETLLDAGRRAAAAGQADALVAAVLANQRGFASSIGTVDEERVALIERALELVGEDSVTQRASLLALLATETVFRGDPARHRRLAREAVALAREAGDDTTTASVLAQVCGPSFDPADVDAWISLTAEALDRASALGDPALQTVAGLFHSAALFAGGDIPGSRSVLQRTVDVSLSAAPALQWAARAQMLRFVIAEQPPAVSTAENAACLALGEAAGEPDCFNWWAGSTTAIHAVQHHRVGALVDVAADYAERFPGARVWRATVALALADQGRIAEAQQVLQSSGLTALAVMQEPFPYFGPTVLARVAFRTADRELAAAVMDALSPHRERWAHYFTGMIGPVSLPLGLCASVLGRHDEAVLLLEEAVDRVRSGQMEVLLLTVELELATVLDRRAAPGDRHRAEDLCRRVLAGAERFGCPGTAADAASLLSPGGDG